MTADQKDYRLPFSIMMAIIGFVMLAWAIPYGIANYKLDQCSQGLQVKLDAFKSEISKTQSSIDAAKKALDHK